MGTVYTGESCWSKKTKKESKFTCIEDGNRGSTKGTNDLQ